MSRLAINYVEHHKSVFDSTISHYMEIKKSHGHTQALDYESAGERVDGNQTTKLVRPNKSDFICDVELAAQRALSQRSDLYQQFRAAFVDQIVSVDVIDRENLALITEQVGRMLVHRRIYPLSAYFAAKDLR